jgi:hypothetical protein
VESPDTTEIRSNLRCMALVNEVFSSL